MLERDTLKFLDEALSVLEQGFSKLPDFIAAQMLARAGYLDDARKGKKI
jgi:hypothetical protein